MTHGYVEVKLNHEVKFAGYYKYDGDAIFTEIITFFTNYSREDITKMFSELEIVSAKQYKELAESIGLGDFYNEETDEWDTIDHKEQFQRNFFEFDQRKFFDNRNSEFDNLMESGRRLILDRRYEKQKLEFTNYTYYIDLNEWELVVNNHDKRKTIKLPETVYDLSGVGHSGNHSN